MHDLVFVPKDSPDRQYGGERSAAAAPAVLAHAGYDANAIAAVADAVRTSSWSRGLVPTAALGRVLQDADRLDALGAVGLMRNLACAQFMAKLDGTSSFYHPEDPLHRTARGLDDKRYAVDHCFAKLLTLAAGMHTTSARVEADLRSAWLRDFLGQLDHETDGQQTFSQ